MSGRCGERCQDGPHRRRVPPAPPAAGLSLEGGHFVARRSPARRRARVVHTVCWTAAERAAGARVCRPASQTDAAPRRGVTPVGSPPAPHRYKRTTSSQLKLPVAGMLDGFRRLAETRIVVNPTGGRRRGTLKEIGSSCLSTMIGGNDPSETSAWAGLRARLGPVGSAREPTGPPFSHPLESPPSTPARR